jgi:hypothetical protein
VKIKDVIQLTEAETVDQRVQRATKTWTDEWNQLPQQNKTPQGLQQFGMDLAKDKSGKQLFTPALPQSVDPKSVTAYISSILSNVFSTQDARQAADINQNNKPALSPHLQQFSISDEGPPLKVFYKKNEYVLNPTTGAWTSYPGGKPIPEPLTQSLNQYIAAVKPTPAKPVTALKGNVQPITVKDKQGEIWTKDEDNNRWVNDAGEVVTDPESIRKLEQHSSTQQVYYNRTTQQPRQTGA